MDDLDPSDEQRHRTIELGFQARQFVATALGQYMVKHWQDEQQQAMEALALVDPHAALQVQKAQNQLHVAYELERRFFALMDRGEEALGLDEHTD